VSEFLMKNAREGEGEGAGNKIDYDVEDFH